MIAAETIRFEKGNGTISLMKQAMLSVEWPGRGAVSSVVG